MFNLTSLQEHKGQVPKDTRFKIRNNLQLVLLCSVFTLFIASGCQAKRQILSIGDKAPDFTLLDLSGNKVSLSQILKGKETILSFWASWCPECRREMPQLERFSGIYKDKIEIIGINVGESKSEIGPFISSLGVNYKILLDSRGEIAKLYGIIGVPTNILINKDGLIKNLNLDVRQMESYLRQNR